MSALGVIFQLHHQAVLRTAYGIVRSLDLAEDVTQQVFIELFYSIKRYDTQRPFRPWLHRIVINLSLDELNRRKNREVPIESMRELGSTENSPEQSAEESELRVAIRNAVGALAPKYRAAVVLRYYHGFSEAEMAVALRCRPGTVKSRLHYALRRVGELLLQQNPPVAAPNLTRLELSEAWEGASPAQCISNPGCGRKGDE